MKLGVGVGKWSRQLILLSILIAYAPAQYIADLMDYRFTERNTISDALPVVLMHGMGDAAHNPGMERIRTVVANHLGTYVMNVPIGNSVSEDTRNGFFMKFDTQVDIFAKEVQKNSRLEKGFNAMGFSQGNLIIRGYIERYNNPPVHNLISVHGPLAGVGALPHCIPTEFLCKKINDIISSAAYTKYVQENIAQANYYRDPTRIPEYLSSALFLPDINNEYTSVNETYKLNFSSLKHLALVRAKKDTMVYPSHSEWFGAYEDGNYSKILPMNETKWYRNDSFGLRTLEQSNKITLYETEGDHLQVQTNDLLHWIDVHFKSTNVLFSV